jgi:hypothetical protein
MFEGQEVAIKVVHHSRATAAKVGRELQYGCSSNALAL